MAREIHIIIMIQRQLHHLSPSVFPHFSLQTRNKSIHGPNKVFKSFSLSLSLSLSVLSITLSLSLSLFSLLLFPFSISIGKGRKKTRSLIVNNITRECLLYSQHQTTSHGFSSGGFLYSSEERRRIIYTFNY